MPDLDRAPLHSTSAALTSMFIAKANKDTDLLQTYPYDYSFFPAKSCKLKVGHDILSVLSPPACVEWIHRHWLGLAKCSL